MLPIDMNRRRPGLIQWLNYAYTDMLPKWSVRRDPSLISCKNFEQKPIISLPNWTEAFQYATRKKDIIKFRHSSTNDNTYYCLPVGDEAKLTEDYCKGYLLQGIYVIYVTYYMMILL